MRTTVRIDDELLAEAKAFAARHHRTLNSVMEDGLRQMLHRQETPERSHVELITAGSGGAMPGVDPSDPAQLKELMYEEEDEKYRQMSEHASC